MKGIIFTELLNFVESQAGARQLEEIIDAAGLDGVYTATGNYPHGGAIRLVEASSERLGIEAGELMRLYGHFLFERLHARYPMFFEGISNSFDFLAGIQTHIHDEVKALYPDTNPPEFEVARGQRSIEIRYRSHRPFAVIAQGMIEACISHFDEDLQVQTSKAIKPGDSQAEFMILPR